MVKTFDIFSNQIDESESFSLNTSSFLKTTIDHGSIEYTLGSAHPGDVSPFELSFEIDEQISSFEDCFIKVTFPMEFNISQVNLTSIRGDGLLANEAGDETTQLENDTFSYENFIAVRGCKYETDAKNVSIKFEGLKNPDLAVNTSAFVIEIFGNVGDQEYLKLARSEHLNITESIFDIGGGIISDA